MNDRTILADVVSRYRSSIALARWTALGAAGGFSGSRIWRGDSADDAAWALKCHPPGMDAARLEQVHHWMQVARNAGLSFVPSFAATPDGRTLVETDGRCWECATWMPGRADFHSTPSEARLAAAVGAVARIHEAWFRVGEHTCPAIQRRIAVFDDWHELVRSGWRPRYFAGDPAAPHAQSAWELLPSLVPRMRAMLEPWKDRLVPLQPCIGDVWHDHMLFENEAVTGVIDFAAAKIDHVASDLARLLGSMIPDDEAKMDFAIRAYKSIRPLPNPELVPILDRSGVVASTVNWLRRLYFAEEEVAGRESVAHRMAIMVGRMSKIIL